MWIVDGDFHHAIEQDTAGSIVAVLSNKPQIDFVPVDFMDDGYAVVSPDGKVVETVSVAEILRDNAYSGLLFGTGQFDQDPIHLNDAHPIHANLGAARIGEIALSVRDLSTVLLYRPSTNRVRN